MSEERLILLGRIVGLFGVEGWVKLESYTEPRMQIFKYRPWLLKSLNTTNNEIADPVGREQGKGIIARLPGFASRDEAATLIGADIWVGRSALPRPKQGEYYWADLEGLEVVTTEGLALGRVSHLFATGSNDVLVVREESGTKERLIPYIPGQVISKVDSETGRITVDWDADF